MFPWFLEILSSLLALDLLVDALSLHTRRPSWAVMAPHHEFNEDGFDGEDFSESFLFH